MYQPHFTITNNLLTYISRIESAKALIENAPLVPAWEAKFRDDAMTRTVHYGTKIEGNDLTEEQAQQVVRLNDVADTHEVIKRTGIMARERDIQEVINYRNVMAWIDRQQTPQFNKVFTEDTLKTIHKLTVDRLVDEEYQGKFRDKQVILRSPVGDVVFRPQCLWRFLI